MPRRVAAFRVPFRIRPARAADLAPLIALENRVFVADRMSARQWRPASRERLGRRARRRSRPRADRRRRRVLPCIAPNRSALFDLGRTRGARRRRRRSAARGGRAPCEAARRDPRCASKCGPTMWPRSGFMNVAAIGASASAAATTKMAPTRCVSRSRSRRVSLGDSDDAGPESAAPRDADVARRRGRLPPRHRWPASGRSACGRRVPRVPDVLARRFRGVDIFFRDLGLSDHGSRRAAPRRGPLHVRGFLCAAHEAHPARARRRARRVLRVRLVRAAAGGIRAAFEAILRPGSDSSPTSRSGANRATSTRPRMRSRCCICGRSASRSSFISSGRSRSGACTRFRRHALRLVVAVGVISFAINLATVGKHPVAAFYSPL